MTYSAFKVTFFQNTIPTISVLFWEGEDQTVAADLVNYIQPLIGCNNKQIK